MASQPIQVRLPEEIHRAYVALAKEQGRSLNGQIVYTLRMALESAGTEPGPTMPYLSAASRT
jgi:predicted HicB family RNase H-like nuclease